MGRIFSCSKFGLIPCKSSISKILLVNVVGICSSRFQSKYHANKISIPANGIFSKFWLLFQVILLDFFVLLYIKTKINLKNKKNVRHRKS